MTRQPTDQLSATDWLDLGLKVLTTQGFTALKAEPLAKAMGVSRGSFYWHFADIGAYHAALLKYWREIATEQVIEGLEAASTHNDPVVLLLQRTYSAHHSLEKAVRSWATSDAAARSAVLAIDRRRLGYVEELLRRKGFASEIAQARAQILYWTFVGYALSDKPLTKTQQQTVLEELIAIATP
jgi:AcrR family transcriptional regulator